MRRKLFFVPAMIALAFVVAFAQQPGASSSSVDRLRQVITYLASDALEGRRTGTPGANEAARYIAGEFARLGLRAAVQPARPTRSRVESLTRYFQPFPYVASVDLGKAIAARNAGAKALLIIAREENLKDDRLARLRYDNNGDAGLPVLVISRQAAMRVFGAKDSTELSRAEEASRALIADQLKKEAPAYGNAGLP